MVIAVTAEHKASAEPIVIELDSCDHLEVPGQQPNGHVRRSLECVDHPFHPRQHANRRAVDADKLVGNFTHVDVAQRVDAVGVRLDADTTESVGHDGTIGAPGNRDPIQRIGPAVQPAERAIHPANSGAERV